MVSFFAYLVGFYVKIRVVAVYYLMVTQIEVA